MVDPSRLGSCLLVTLPTLFPHPFAPRSPTFLPCTRHEGRLLMIIPQACVTSKQASTRSRRSRTPPHRPHLSFFFLFLLSTPLAPTWVMLSPSWNEVRKVMVRHIVQLRLSANGPSIIKGQAAADATRCLCFPNENRWCFCLSEQLLHSAFNAAVNQLAGWLKEEDLCNLQQEEIAQNYW